MNRSKQRSKRDVTFLISYIPLLDPRDLGVMAGEDIISRSDCDKILKSLDINQTVGECRGCMWVQHPPDDPNSVIPVLVLEQAKAVVRHLIMWSEHEPHAWFDLQIYHDDYGYVLVLMPKYDMSVQRFRLGRLANFSDLESTDRFELVTRPIRVACVGGKTYDQVRDQLTDSLFVGFLDTDQIDMQNPASIDPNDIQVLGPFQVTYPKSGYIKEFLHSAKQEL